MKQQCCLNNDFDHNECRVFLWGCFFSPPQCFLKESYLISFVLLYRLRIYSQRIKMFLVTVSSSLSRLSQHTKVDIRTRTYAFVFENLYSYMDANIPDFVLIPKKTLLQLNPSHGRWKLVFHYYSWLTYWDYCNVKQSARTNFSPFLLPVATPFHLLRNNKPFLLWPGLKSEPLLDATAERTAMAILSDACGREWSWKSLVMEGKDSNVTRFF